MVATLTPPSVTPASRPFLPLVLALLLCVGHLSPAQQTPPSQPSQLDTRPLVEAALKGLDAAETEHARFTDFVELQIIGFLPGGANSKPNYDHKFTYEETWINDLPYSRLVEKDGIPLTGTALDAEKKRYEKAIADRKKLGPQQRGKYDRYGNLPENGIDVSNVLKSDYVLREPARVEDSDPRIRVVEAFPKVETAARSTCPWHYTLLIAGDPAWLVAYRADSPNSTSPPCLKASDEVTISLIDGYPRTLYRHLVTFERRGFGYGRVENIVTYSKIRRFTASYTLKFGAELDETPATVPPKPK